MNKKGFTLVELLAVIVILGLLMTIVATKGFGAFDNTKKKIEQEQEKLVLDAKKIIEADLESCDDDLKDYDDIKSYFNGINSVSSCEDLKNKINKVTINYNALTSNSDNISDEIKNNYVVYNINTMKLEDYVGESIRNKKYIHSLKYMGPSQDNGQSAEYNARIEFKFKTISSGKISFNILKNSFNIKYITVNGGTINFSDSFSYNLNEKTDYTIIIYETINAKRCLNYQYGLVICNFSFDDKLEINNFNIDSYLEENSFKANGYSQHYYIDSTFSESN